MKERKIPVRQSLWCNEHKPKLELIRVVRAPQGEISLDLTGKKSGRGAYVCRSISCFNKARKSKRIERALDCSIPDEIYDAMAKELEDAE